ncbi:hypothetical protein [Streptomyces sp. URMC 129]|uniref:hypothetical protein n=1 Tax=Streptomyces sp. URMC 129 TaxID=3423407 RepID=UPI003F1BE4BC
MPRTTHHTTLARKNNTVAAEGVWDLSISTPIGTIEAVVEFARQDGVLAGTARGAAESVALSDITLEGDRLAWKQAVTKPLRLNLAFAVTLDGDTLTGTSKAGRLPASKVTGRTPRRPSGRGPLTMTKLLVSLHVLAAVLAIGPRPSRSLS